MNLSDYERLIGEIDGKPSGKLAEGVTTKELDFRGGTGKDGSATIYFKDGKPIMVSWYEWSLEMPYLLEQLGKELGGWVKLIDTRGGNGHYRAVVELDGHVASGD